MVILGKYYRATPDYFILGERAPNIGSPNSIPQIANIQVRDIVVKNIMSKKIGHTQIQIEDSPGASLSIRCSYVKYQKIIILAKEVYPHQKIVL